MRMKTIAPRIGPTRVPMPPMITIMSPWPEKTQNMTSGEAKPRKGANSAPARPANTAAMTKTTSLRGRGWRPGPVERALVLADGLQRATERGTDDGAADHEREHHAGSYQEIERVRRGQARPAP